jgi:hypothetical protein
MRFARVVGTVVSSVAQPGGDQGFLDLTVTLDRGTSVETVRSASVPVLPVPEGEDMLEWQADQYTQETIANELADQGWEPIGVVADTDPRRGAVLGRSSPTYVVRQTQEPAP